MSYILWYDAGKIKTIAAIDSHTNISLYVGTGSRYIDTLIDSYPKTSAGNFKTYRCQHHFFCPDQTIPRCYQQFFWYRYFAGIRFIWRSVFPVGITNLAGTPFYCKRGAGCIKKGAGAPFFLEKGAVAPFLRKIGFPAKKIIPKCPDRDFLWYRYGKYREIPTDTDRKIPIRYTTLDMVYQR